MRVTALGNGVQADPLLWLEPVEETAVTHARRTISFGGLKCHKPPIGRNYRIRCLATLVIVEIRQAGEVLPCSIKSQFPDVNISGATNPSQPLAFAVA